MSGLKEKKLPMVKTHNPIKKAKDKKNQHPPNEEEKAAADELDKLYTHIEEKQAFEVFSELRMECNCCGARRFARGAQQGWVDPEELDDETLCPSCEEHRDEYPPDPPACNAAARGKAEGHMRPSMALEAFNKHLANFTAAWVEKMNLKCTVCGTGRFASTPGGGEWSVNDYGEHRFAVCPVCTKKCGVCQEHPPKPVEECEKCCCEHPVCDDCPLIYCSECGGTTCSMCILYDPRSSKGCACVL